MQGLHSIFPAHPFRVGLIAIYCFYFCLLTFMTTESYQFFDSSRLFTRPIKTISIPLLQSKRSFHFTSIPLKSGSSLQLSQSSNSAFHSPQSAGKLSPLFKISNLSPVRDRQLILNSASSSTVPSESLYYDVKIISNTKEAEGLRLVTIEVPSVVAESYTKPGQYVKLRVKDGSNNSKPFYFAIASPPARATATSFTFLIKEIPQHDFVLSPSTPLEISAAIGSGFNVNFALNDYKKDFPVTNILLFATGSGIAPMVSVIESNQLFQSNSLTNLITVSNSFKIYYGVRSPKHLAFQSKFDEWKKKGIEVIPVISQPDDPLSTGWTGKKGYIQDILKDEEVHVPRNTAALLCGQRGMTDSIKEILLQAGVFEGRILFNF